jgi:predicted phosphodiesterase
VGEHLTRIVSDVHFGDRGSRVRSLDQLRPLLDGTHSLVFNGDTLDTRPGKNPGRTAQMRADVLGYFGAAGRPVTFLTGNHDPDLSGEHSLEFGGGKLLVTHGDVLFEDIVPWSRDADVIRKKIIAALASIPDGEARSFEGRMSAFRSVAATVSQLHQSETNPFKYAIRLAGDTVWPPDRALKIFKAWREAPGRAAELAGRHRPKARFIAIGHTHKPGVWKTRSGVVVVNTGSFCRPFGPMAADITADRIRVRRVESRRGEFRAGAEVASFPLS